jgi:hypothetical protein
LKSFGKKEHKQDKAMGREGEEGRKMVNIAVRIFV